MAGFCLDWVAGASAQIELFNGPGKNGYQLKYMPAFRSAIRPPVRDLFLGPSELEPIDNEINRVLDRLSTRPRDAQAAAKPASVNAGVGNSLVDGLKNAGSMLFNAILARYVQADLHTPGLFLEIGMDEALLGYPWELMHDEGDFLCIKHLPGRFINTTGAIPVPMSTANASCVELGTVSVLLIVVSNPQPRSNGTVYEHLSAAKAEATSIAKTLGALPNVNLKVLSGEKATLTGVVSELGKHYDIVHFCGHAHFNENNPRGSKLVLFDEDMYMGFILPFFQKARPILCFINACQSASAKMSKDDFNVIGLARVFLETGAYLLGTRWNVSDTGASEFAKTFYQALLGNNKPLGCAVRDARIACRNAVLCDDVTWASYVLYGDSRLCFRRKS